MKIKVSDLKRLIREQAMDQAKLGIASSFPSGKVAGRADVDDTEDDQWTAEMVPVDIVIDDEPPTYDVEFDDLDATTDPHGTPMAPDTPRAVPASSRRILKVG